MNYYPIIFSINYKSQGNLHAFMCYGQFNKDSTNRINGVQIIKQVILVSLPTFIIMTRLFRLIRSPLRLRTFMAWI